MPLVVDFGLAAAIAANTGAVHLEVRDASDAEAVRRGLVRARQLLYEISHPEEPEDPLPSAAKAVEGAHGPSLWFDIADAEAYPGLIDEVIDSVVCGLEAEGVSGTLGMVSPS